MPRQIDRGQAETEPISKQGDRYLRRILVVGAIAVLRRAQENPGKYPWLTQLLARVIGATAIVATVADPTIFRSGTDVAARGSGWCRGGRISTGGKQKLGPISKQGDRYLRRILVVGAIAVLRRAQEIPGKYPWLTQLLARRPFKVDDKMAMNAIDINPSAMRCRK